MKTVVIILKQIGVLYVSSILLLFVFLNCSVCSFRFFFWDSSGKINGDVSRGMPRWSVVLNSMFVITVVTFISIFLTNKNDSFHNKELEGSYVISKLTLNDITQNLPAGSFTHNPM